MPPKPSRRKVLEKIGPLTGPLTLEEKLQITHLNTAGVSITAISAQIRRPHDTVRHFLSKYMTTEPLAKAVLKSGSERLARRIVAHATVNESLEVLDRLDVLPKRERDSSAGAPQFTLVIGMPGKPGPTPPEPKLIGGGKA